MNYPTNQGYIDYKQKGEEEMVEMIVNIVAANTDPEIEPTPTFKYALGDLGISTSRRRDRRGRGSRRPR
jgi:hypothetical protein